MSRLNALEERIACDQPGCSNSMGDARGGACLFTDDEDPGWAIEDYEYLTVGGLHYCPNHWPDYEPHPSEQEREA